MGVANFEELREHQDHNIVVVVYGGLVDGRWRNMNAAVECESCGEVLFDYDAEEEEPDA